MIGENATFLRTRLATDWPESGRGDRVVRALLRFIPRANPDYEDRMHLVREWLIEFADEGFPRREIGLDRTGTPIVAGPDHRNYGFWLDTNMKLVDFEGEIVDAQTFEARWRLFHESGGFTATD